MDLDQLSLIRRGVREWNEWRRSCASVRPVLRGADLQAVDLHGADLSGSDLVGARLAGADLHKANLGGAFILSADISGASLIGANLREANLARADLSGANLQAADLQSADLRHANLTRANIAGVNLTSVNLTGAIVGWATFGDVDLTHTLGLELVRHVGPSTIGIDTILRSGGSIPPSFLRGAGVPETFIVYMQSLVAQPIEFCSCFISYSSKDHSFAEHLHDDLRRNNVRCWFAPEDLKIGDRFRTRIDESIRVHDKLLLILTENSIASPWVEDEVEAALERERLEQRNVLFPIRMDDSVMKATQAWAANIRQKRHIGDFRHWENPDLYQHALQRLLRDLTSDFST